MSPKDKATWIMPASSHRPENVWVMIARVFVKGGALHSLRVFTTEPTAAIIEHQKRILCSDPDAVDVDVFETLPDHFDIDDVAAMDA